MPHTIQDVCHCDVFTLGDQGNAISGQMNSVSLSSPSVSTLVVCHDTIKVVLFMRR